MCACVLISGRVHGPIKVNAPGVRGAANPQIPTSANEKALLTGKPLKV